MPPADTVSPMASKHKTSSSSSPSRDHPDTHIDRNSAIALSIMLFLILVAIAWYLRLHFAQKRQADLERQLQVEQGQSESAMESVTWNSQCSSYSSQETSLAQTRNPCKPKAAVTRKSSTTPSCSSDTSGQRQESEKKKSLRSSQQRSSQDTRNATLEPHNSFIHDETLPMTSTERRPSSTHSPRRQSSKSFFDPLRLHNPVYAVAVQRRSSSSLSRDTYDKRWWNEVAPRGSTTSPTRRSSVLEVVPEPSVASREPGRGSIGSAHASWKGGRCESVIYDWTRPTDAGALARSDMDFQSVTWDGQHSKTGSAKKENIQSMDWALLK